MPPAAGGAAVPLRPGALRHAVVIEAGSGQIVALGAAAASVFAADPKVAEVRPASPTALFVFGVAPGRTTVAALDAGGRPIGQYEVTVRPSAFGAAEATRTIGRLLPGRSVQVQQTVNGMVLSGEVGNAAEAEQAAAAVRDYLAPGQKLDNRLSVAAGIQVSLRVRIAEMDRTIIRELGVNWQALGNIGKYTLSFATNNALASAATAATALGVGYVNRGVNVSAIIDALAQDNLVHLLAEPNLTAMSGETASFLVGGEFPIPVAQANGALTIQFQQFGVSLAFVPTVLSSGRINLHVRPEVSQLTNQGAVQLSATNSSISVPALTVRRADTTVELGSGQSFAIAGLLQDMTTQSDSGLPWLGELPIIGALFRSESFQRNETELVIVVTPYIVRPPSDPSAVHLPSDGWGVPNDVERILLLRQQARIGAPLPVRVPGDAGFIVQ
ncbi:MAG: type II and III secretion system protein family protein [Alphaproteobacteria bacterium]|nr:type II and III secretion system protein family protein [Alphaproteobacteria bacterium]